MVRKRNMFIGIFLVILVIVLVIISININEPKDYLFIDNENIYFGMSKSLLMDINGKPTESNGNVSDTPRDEYIYMKEILGQCVEIHYYLHNARLVETYMIADGVSYDSAMAMTQKIISKQKNYYSSREGYYHSELETDNTTQFVVSNGIRNGAIGISFDFEYSSGKLTISAINQK